MKRKVILSFAVLAIVALLAVTKESSGQRPVPQCQNSTVVLTNTIYNNVFSKSATGLQFFTNEVCGATSYSWMIDDFTVAVTRAPFLTLNGEDFVNILPLGSCDTFNSRLSNFDITSTYGTYATSLTVRANGGAQNAYTIPIYVTGVSKCKISEGKIKVKGKRGDGQSTSYGGIGG